MGVWGQDTHYSVQSQEVRTLSDFLHITTVDTIFSSYKRFFVISRTENVKS